MPHPAATLFDWGVFAAAVLGLMAVDLLILGRSHHMSFREAAVRSLMCVSVGFGFSAEKTAGLWLPGPYEQHRLLGCEFVAGGVGER